MKTIYLYNATSDNIREIIKRVGNQIGGVHFYRRKDGKIRKMCYRLHVKEPKYANSPIDGDIRGVNTTDTDNELGTIGLEAIKVNNRLGSVIVQPASNLKKDTAKDMVSDSIKRSRKDIDYVNEQMTVFDVNKPVRGGNGEIIGRGAWRTIPLEKVTQIMNNGCRYIVCKQ